MCHFLHAQWPDKGSLKGILSLGTPMPFTPWKDCMLLHQFSQENLSKFC